MKSNFRITFYDGPEGNRSKNVDVYAESLDDARKQAWQMPEARNRMYSDMMIEQIPEGPSVIGVEYEQYDAHFKQYFTDRVFIKANSEAQALKYFNEYFSDRGRATKTYFAAGFRCDADATIEEKESSLSDKISQAKAQGSVSDKEPDKADFSRLER